MKSVRILPSIMLKLQSKLCWFFNLVEFFCKFVNSRIWIGRIPANSFLYYNVLNTTIFNLDPGSTWGEKLWFSDFAYVFSNPSLGLLPFKRFHATLKQRTYLVLRFSILGNLTSTNISRYSIEIIYKKYIIWSYDKRNEYFLTYSVNSCDKRYWVGSVFCFVYYVYVLLHITKYISIIRKIHRYAY